MEKGDIFIFNTHMTYCPSSSSLESQHNVAHTSYFQPKPTKTKTRIEPKSGSILILSTHVSLN